MDRTAPLFIIFLALATIYNIPAEADPPDNLDGLVLGATPQGVKQKYGTSLKLSLRNKDDMAASRCGIDRYEIDLANFQREELFFYKGKLYDIRLGMEASLTTSESFALAKRLISKYGNPTEFICGPLDAYSIEKCKSSDSITLVYEKGREESSERHELHANVFSKDESDPHFKGLGYYMVLTKGWNYYYDTTEACRKKAMLAIDEENAESITLPE